MEKPGKVMRRLSRETAMQIAFARLLGGNTSFDDVIRLSYDEEKSEEILERRAEADIAFAESIVVGVESHCETLDEIINDYLNNWTTRTIPKLDLTILRIAVYELKFTPEVPQGAVINEAVELAKRYSDEKSYAYINGVLSSVSKDIKKQYI